MRMYFAFFLSMLLLLEGCASSTVEDPPIFQPEGFKEYVKPGIYIDDSLILKPESEKKQSEPQINSDPPESLQSGSAGVKDTKTTLEWVAGPDRDTTWDEARSWVQSLSDYGGGWRMPAMKELETLHRKGDTFLLSNTTGKWVWSGETKGLSAGLFSFRYGVGKWISRGYSKGYRGFAVRLRK